MLVTLASGTNDNHGEQLDRLVTSHVPPELRVPFYLAWEIEEFDDGYEVECGTQGCDGSPLDWSTKPWWRGE
jgi:hypothetical protein